jgi:hypothetical protein
MEIQYGPHPSEALREVFRSKPYQGQDPRVAKLIVLGTDANYSPRVSDHAFFSTILEYHEDGVGFWRRNGVHHPFLLPSYPFDRRRDGVRYHRNFQKLGLGPKHADLVSFVELLDMPTIGVTVEGTFLRLLRPAHLAWLEDALFSGGRKLVLINQRLMRTVHQMQQRSGALPILSSLLRSQLRVGESVSSGSTSVLNGYSFSHTVTDAYLMDLGAQIRGFFRDRE